MTINSSNLQPTATKLGCAMASSTCVYGFKHLADTIHVFWQSNRNFNLATGNQSQWDPSRMASFPAAFRISCNHCSSPPSHHFVFLSKFLFVSFCSRLEPSLMFCYLFSYLVFSNVSLFLGRTAVLVIREVSRLLRLEDFEEILQLFAR